MLLVAVKLPKELNSRFSFCLTKLLQIWFITECCICLLCLHCYVEAYQTRGSEFHVQLKISHLSGKYVCHPEWLSECLVGVLGEVVHHGLQLSTSQMRGAAAELITV